MKVIITAGSPAAGMYPGGISGKGFEKLFDEKAVFQKIYKAALSITDEKNIAVTVPALKAAEIKDWLKEEAKLPNIIIEPMNRNTACSIAAALCFLEGKRSDTVIILPACCSFSQPNALKEALEDAKPALKKGYIAAFGAKIKNARHGAGYLKTNDEKKGVTAAEFISDEIEISALDIKADGKTGAVYRNTGIYAAKMSVLSEEFAKYAPEITETFSKDMFDENNAAGYEYYVNLSDKTIEQAVISKTQMLAYAELKTKYKNYSSMQALYDFGEKDENGNITAGCVISDNISNSFIYSSKELTAVSDISDAAVINTEDALIVCSKDRLKDIQKLKSELQKQKLNADMLNKTVFRQWGVYTFLNRGNGWLTKTITVYPGHKLTMQMHNHRSEHWVVLEGEAFVILEDKTFTLERGRSINIPVQAKHSLQNLTEAPLRILEVQKGNYISEDDIIRFDETLAAV